MEKQNGLESSIESVRDEKANLEVIEYIQFVSSFSVHNPLCMNLYSITFDVIFCAEILCGVKGGE